MSVFSRILSSKPVNKTASRVTSGGMHYSEKVGHCIRIFEAPPHCIPPEKYPHADSFVDYRGARIGRMVVMGYLGKIGSKKAKASWLLRCDCGAYQASNVKAITQGKDQDKCCAKCQHNRRIKWLASDKKS